MRSIRARDTHPERCVRSLLHRMGYRYRLHAHGLPGTPDLVFPSRKRIVFVHGCFWHRHTCRKGRSMPATRTGFWRKKLEGNKQRDQRVRRQLRRLGWRVFVVWECQLHPTKIDRLTERLVNFLEAD